MDYFHQTIVHVWICFLSDKWLLRFLPRGISPCHCRALGGALCRSPTVLVYCFMYLSLLVGVLFWSLFWYAFVYVLSSFAMIMTKRELVDLPLLSFGCLVTVMSCSFSSQCCGLVCSLWLLFFLILYESKKMGKDQEPIQPSTTPDPEYQWKSDNVTIGHHKREPIGQHFPSRWPQGINKQTCMKA